MHDIPLNDTQRIFAEKNHNLVYKFLHKKNLPASEYYDIVIFGYLRAVQRYLTDPNLAGYSFATVAWRAMEGEVANTRRTDKRRFRVIRFVRPRQSYTGHLTRRPTPTETDEEALRESEVALLLHPLIGAFQDDLEVIKPFVLRFHLHLYRRENNRCQAAGSICIKQRAVL